MGLKVPGLCDLPEAIPELTNPKIIGTMNVQGSVKINSVAISATPGDLNLIAGVAAGAITSGFSKYFEVEVNASGGGIAQTATIVTIPAGSIIHDILTYCTEAFNSGTAHTFEVGIAANTDKYIDPVDCPHTLAGVMSLLTGTNQDQKTPEPIGAAMAIIATWTNTTGTAGKMKVKVIYT